VEQGCATAYSSAIQAIDSTSLPKFIAFLKEMKVTIPDDAKQADVVTAVKALGRKAEDDPALSAQFCAALQKTGVIRLNMYTGKLGRLPVEMIY